MHRLARLLFVLSLLCQAVPAWAASVTTFSPEGSVKGVRQVTAGFSEAMVPFGDLHLADPFTVDCAAAGKGRWVDGRHWSYDFDGDLPGGIACSFRLKPELKSLAGGALSGKQLFGFDTGGPAVVQTVPGMNSWSADSIDEQQMFILVLDALPRPASILEHAYCAADGINEKIGVRLIGGRAREEILHRRKDFLDRYLDLYYKARGQSWKTTIKLQDLRPETLPVVVLQCRQTLPSDAKMRLVWDAGISTLDGIVTSAPQTLDFRTRDPFKAEVSCTRVNADAQCVPFLPIHLHVTAPIPLTTARAIRLTDQQGRVYPSTIHKQNIKSGQVEILSFKGPLPALTSFTIKLPAMIKDDAGRSLVNQADFPMTIKTDELPPLAKFPARFGLLEAHGDRALPVTLRNLEAGLTVRSAQTAARPGADDIKGSKGSKGSVLRVADQQDSEILDWLGRLNILGTGAEIGKQYDLRQTVFQRPMKPRRFSLPKPNGARAFEVVGIPLPGPGFYVVELESPRLGAAINKEGGTAYVHSAALVTNLAAHFKHGSESSLVWVTSLDKGRPVPGAQVVVRDCKGKSIWQGKTDKTGVAHIREALDEGRCTSHGGFFVSVRSGADMSFTLSSWGGGIQSWRFGVPTASDATGVRMAHTVFDRTLLRAGETVHMKHFLRRQSTSGIVLAEPATLPALVEIVHLGGDQRFKFPLAWTPGQTAVTDWVIPANARQGLYEVVIGGARAGTFRVESFRVPTMRAVIEGPKVPLVQADAVTLDLQLNYLAGGVAAKAPVKLRSVLQKRSVQFTDYPAFAINMGDVREGVLKSEHGDNEEDGPDEPDEPDGAADGMPATMPATVRSLTLDGAGAARVSIDKLPRSSAPQQLLAEFEYQDANGETLNSSTRIPLWPAARLIGIQPEGWSARADNIRFQVVVLDLQGKPVAGAPVTVDLFEDKTYSHRRRLIGGFYAYENTREIKRLGAACAGSTDDRGLLHCVAKTRVSGSLILRATTMDQQGNASITRQNIWVEGTEDETSWFDARDSDRIDLLPGKKSYQPGDTATLQVRMPFREATALVTVEREGVIESSVQHLSGKDPQVHVTIKAGHAPNVYVSVFVVRGRVAGVQPTALLDLGKPAYKMGLVQLQVGWQAHALEVAVATDKPVYKTREKAQVKIKVRRADGSVLPRHTEVALAAVDVGLLELMPNESWKLLEAMMQTRSLQVETATAQMQVIGKRHFGRKAVAHGGGGGKGGARELFDTLLLWKASVPLDAKGEATIEVPLNDTLGQFRIVAVASGNADLFGTGETTIRSTQDVIIVSGLPSVVREGDQLRAAFTLRNTTDKVQELQLDASLSIGSSSNGSNNDKPQLLRKLAPQTVRLAAGAAQEVYWDATVPLNVQTLVWDLAAQGDGAVDRLRIRQKVTPAVPLRTWQATLMQLDGPLSMNVQMPSGAQPGRGGIDARLSPHLGGELPGVQEYMRRYPFTCFEQNASKAIALRDATLWHATVATLPAYLDNNGLLKYFATMERGSDSLTAYLLSAAHEAGYALPPAVKVRMEDALIAFVEGRLLRPSLLPAADLGPRKLAALEAISRSRKITPAWFDSIAIEPDLWPTSAVLDWYLVLQRNAGLKDRDAKLARAEQILRLRLNFQGTSMGFSTERNDDLWWLMISPDVNANRLLLAMLDNPRWTDDMGRIARGALGRQKKGRWGTTVANAWGVLALDKFSKKFESQVVDGSTTAVLGQVRKSLAWQQMPEGGRLELPWNGGRENLKLTHAGGGKPWVTISSIAAVPLKTPVSSGYQVRKSMSPVQQKTAGVWSRGDVVRVRLELEAQSDMSWVVVEDPVATGVSILGSGLGRDSSIMTRDEKRAGWVWPAFEERTAQAFRAYYEFVPKGKWTVEYTMRLNQQGEFTLPPTHVEAMYAPEMLGELPNARMVVKP